MQGKLQAQHTLQGLVITFHTSMKLYQQHAFFMAFKFSFPSMQVNIVRGWFRHKPGQSSLTPDMDHHAQRRIWFMLLSQTVQQSGLIQIWVSRT